MLALRLLFKIICNHEYYMGRQIKPNSPTMLNPEDPIENVKASAHFGSER